MSTNSQASFEATPKPLSERLESGELRFLTNLTAFDDYWGTEAHDQRLYLDDLRRQLGDGSVTLGSALTDHGPTGMPGMTGLYVDAERWAELYPDASPDSAASEN